LDQATTKTLQQHRIALLELHALHADIWLDNDMVFPMADGRVRSPQIARNRLPDLCAAAGVPELSPHGLRHTAASLLLSAGVPAKVVSERLGHSSITITMDVYMHVSGAMQLAAAEALGKALG
jgi:integrase